MKKLITLLIICFAFQGFAQTMRIDKEISNVTVDIILSDYANINYKDSIVYFEYEMVIYLKGNEIARPMLGLRVPLISDFKHKELFWSAIKQRLELKESDYTIK